MKRALAIVIGVLVLLLGAGALWVRSLLWEPAPVEELAIECRGAPPRLHDGQRLTVLVWNLQFAGSRKHHFFYDGGQAVHVPDADVQATTAAIAEVIRTVGPDLAILQEVDRDSARTGHLDQLAPYLAAGPWGCWASTPYFKAGYVPAPSSEPLGKMDMHLSILSRYAIASGERIDLPRLKESALRQAFNLKRALQWVSMPVEGGPPLRVGNTHLSAFSKGDGTLAEQVAVLDGFMARDESFLMAGDLNLLPPGDDPGRLGKDAGLYADAENPIAPLLSRYAEVAGPDWLEPSDRTYLPFGSSEPDRRLDYVFHGRQVHLVEARVLAEVAHLSDHLPLLVTVQVGGSPPASPPEVPTPEEPATEEPATAE